MKHRYLLMLAVSIFVASAGARADTVDKDGLLRGDNGELLGMNQADAIKACAKHGMHLPAIRKLVELNQAAGLEIRKSIECTYDDHLIRGFRNESGVTPDGKYDHFCISNRNYTRPSGDLGNYWFWSSSVNPQYPFLGVAFEGDHGFVVDLDTRVTNGKRHFYDLAVRCVPGQ